MRLERLISTRTARGPLYCPRCCWKLGRAESASIGYLTMCGGCKRSVRVVEMEATGELAIVVAEDGDATTTTFVELER